MRIIQLVHTSIQFEPPVFALGKTLAQRGHEVICIGYWQPGLPLEQDEVPGYKLIRIRRGDFQQLPRFFRGAIRLARYWSGVYRIAHLFKPDVIIPFGYDVLPITHLITPSRNRIIYYCTEYAPKPKLQQYMTGWGFLKLAEKWFVRNSGKLVSVESNRAVLQEQEWDRSVDYIILNAPPFDEEMERYAISKILLKENSIRLVYAGSISARNCLVELMAAVQEMPGTSLDIYGRVVSEYSELFHADLQRYCKISGNRIQYHGAVAYKDLMQLLTHYDVGVSFYDGKDTNTLYASPAKLFEYMRAGLALLSTCQPTPARIIGESASGLLVDITKPGQLLNILGNLLQQPELLRQMRHNAINSFHQRYAYEQQAKALVDYIETLQG